MAKDPNSNYQKVWLTVQQIPFGKVATYGQIADLAGLPNRARLVGKALGTLTAENQRNTPWHRVINSQGKISLPVGSDSFTQQRTLLLAEGVMVCGNKIKLSQFQWQPDLAELLFKLTC
ncbi:MAG: MGMT family protein [Thalassotalea sp.]